VEPRQEGGFSVKKTGAKRASAVTPTQGEGIKEAKSFDPNKKPHIARVRTTKAGKPGQLRKTP
jgi:hypothetical protein